MSRLGLGRSAFVFLLCAVVAGQALAGAEDPWEGFNRKIFSFNETVDRWALKPLARGYRAVVPDRVERHVSNVFRNLMDVVSATNHALQGEGRYAADTAGRIVANTLLGVGGVFDVASAGGIPRRTTGFGTTLGKWGVGSGPYLVLPFVGPSTVRDASALPVNFAIHPVAAPWTIIEHTPTRFAVGFVDVIDTRAGMLRYEQAIVGDRYVFLRDIYLQRGAAEVTGETGDEPAADPFLDDEPDHDGNVAEPEAEPDRESVE